MNQYQLWSKRSKFQALEAFRKTLFTVAQHELKGLKVTDVAGASWSLAKNTSFQDWLSEQPHRISSLQQGKLILVQSSVKAA